MKYQDVKDLLPNANHIYVGVTEKEISKVVAEHYYTEFEESKVLGALEPIESLAAKELLAGSVSFN